MSAFQSKSKPPKKFDEQKSTLKDCLTTEGASELNTITLESRIIVPPGHLYSNPPPPPIINFQSFLLTFMSVNSHFHHSPS